MKWLIYLWTTTLFASWVDDTNTFAYRVSCELTGDNCLFSPIATRACLFMALLGAEGATKARMEETLGIKMPDLGKIPGTVANSLWISEDTPILESFQTALTTHFHSQMYSADFSRPDLCITKINQWVSGMTQGMIPALLDTSHVDLSTKLVLVSTLLFKSPWLLPFSLSATEEEPFFSARGKVEIPMMHARESLLYAETAGWKVVALPCKQWKQVCLLLCLPQKEGPMPIPPGLLNFFLEKLHPTDLDLTLPRWTADHKLPLNALLDDFGMGIAFSSEADFSKITGDHRLALSSAVTQSRFEVTEAGLSAASAAAAAMNCTMTFSDPCKTLRFDRPFTYLLIDRSTGLILFQGELWHL